MRLERKEGVELSSLFKRKEGNSLGKGKVEGFELSGLELLVLLFFKISACSISVLCVEKTPNVLLITIVVRSTGSPRKLKLLLNINFPSLSIHRENQRDRIIFQPSRTNIRSRFQR